MTTRFIGRKEEIDGLKNLIRKKSASLVVIKGRRRIGKTRLAEEFAGNFDTHYTFAGLAPSEVTTSQDQKTEFLRQMKRQGIRSLGDSDWGSLFDDVATACQKGKILVLLDEISWMGHNDDTFLAKLKNSWDLEFKKNPNLILILSGSNATWIEKNILTDTGFVGRISYRLTLEELSLFESNKFWGKNTANISSFEKFKILSITGGVPRYLEEILPQESAEENIQRLCFRKEGLLFHEFEDTFSDALSKKSGSYRVILKLLAEGRSSLGEVAKAIGRNRPDGDVSEFLEDLCSVGFVTRDYTWNLESGNDSIISLFRLSDNYIRFYLKFIEPNKEKILGNTMRSLPKGWDSIMGLQFENLILSKNNRLKIYELLGIPLESIVRANPFLQTQTVTRQKCQIDFLIQTKEGNLYICEIKFKKDEVDSGVVSEVKEKIKRLKRKKHMSCRPVLIHVNGVSESIQQNDYFIKIIDFGKLLCE
ncbi:MAG: ATP-binding protein [Chlamydiota bacterium]